MLDQETNEFISAISESTTWIGGFREDDNEEVWYWTDGETWSFDNWGDGQPDNGNPNSYDQKFVSINYPSGSGFWDDVHNLTYPYICQFKG